MVVHLDTMVPSMKTDYDIPGILPLKDMVFNRPALFENYRQLLKGNEDVDKFNNKGLYTMDDKFNMIILSNMEDPDCDDEIIQMVLD